ncbi:MAG: Extracellular solute-binding protein [Candidatus Magasanikbacteria bacterium GW2011_GWC2_37_14]|uniref:Extracellular solute-binding protein n=1 Tax=Candidatus Magasanikbacteria bacterium GW2011_GWC2_37_14 TaxID=1619046 RepID=A0A0G0GP57_9BACT|nr:MAG: Extracellular solute-binding protein [Candidatus Magasanikbacteria bacterium GW2011_GWC2_37_14]
MKEFLLKIKNRLFRYRSQPIAPHHYDVRLLQQVKGRFWPRWHQLTQINRVLSSFEKKLFKLAFFVLLIGLFWVGSSWVKAHRIQAPAIGGTVTEAVVGSPQFINPIFAISNDVDMDISRLVFSGLMRYDEKNKLVPNLTVKYNLSADKKVYTFELRRDVLWHDNEPFTSKDVVFTFEAIQNILVGSPLYVSFQGVKVEAPDDYTVVFTLPEAYSPFLNSLVVGILPEHAWFNVLPEQMRLAQTNIQPIGTGPFMFKKFTKDESGRIYNYELVRFENFYRQLAFLEGFNFQFYSAYDGDSGAIQAVRNQKVDSLSFVPKNLRERIERKHIVLKILQLPQYTTLFFNQTRNEVLKDKNIRLALAESLDKERILKEAINGEGQIINSPVLPDSPGYNSEIGKINYDITSANVLLDKEWPKITAEEYKEIRRQEILSELQKSNTTAVATSTSNAVSSTEQITPELQKQVETTLNTELNQAQTFYRKNKDGKILEINLVTVGTEEYKQAAGMIAGFWQEVGVKTKVDFVASRDFSKEVLRNRDYDVLLYGEIIGSDPDQYPFWHSSQANFPGLNLAGYVNRNADATLQKIRVTTDEKEKAELYKSFQELLTSELPAIFLYMPTYTYALSDTILGVDVTKISHPADRFADVVTWYMKTSGKWNFQ